MNAPLIRNRALKLVQPVLVASLDLSDLGALLLELRSHFRMLAFQLWERSLQLRVEFRDGLGVLKLSMSKPFQKAGLDVLTASIASSSECAIPVSSSTHVLFHEYQADFACMRAFALISVR